MPNEKFDKNNSVRSIFNKIIIKINIMNINITAMGIRKKNVTAILFLLLPS